jgi:hypothetical protein
MTLRTGPIVTVTVTKKPDGRLVLNYTRLERTTAPPSSQECENRGLPQPQVKDPCCGLTAEDAAQDNQRESQPRNKALPADSLATD